MLTRDEIAERLAAIGKTGPYGQVMFADEREALETAQKLGEWLEVVAPVIETTPDPASGKTLLQLTAYIRPEDGPCVAELLAWLRGEGE